MRRSRRSPERGAGSVLVLGIAAAVMVLGAALGVLGQAAATRHRAEAAADLAALAAADAALGRAPGEPCARAARTAVLNGARLTGCLVAEDGSVRVGVEADVRGVVRRLGAGVAHGAARAGPVP